METHPPPPTRTQRRNSMGPPPGLLTIMDPDLTLVLLGFSGVGKSASGNSILGRVAFESRLALSSVTKNIDEQTGRVFEKSISVIDTPDISASWEEIKTLCHNISQSNRQRLFLVVVKIDRFTEEQKKAVEASVEAIGANELKNSFVLFTKGDKLNDMSLDEFIKDPESALPGLVERFAGKFVFNNKETGREQVKQLLLKSGHLQPDVVSDLQSMAVSQAAAPQPAAPQPAVTTPVNPRRQMKIILIGLPGQGKSSSGNTILGSDHFKSEDGFNAVTLQTSSKSENINGENVTVVDTPGFGGESLPPKKLYYEIRKAIEEVSPGPHAFLFVVEFHRISEAAIMLFEILPKLFGGDAHKYVIVLFTHGDKLRGQPIEEKIQANRQVSNIVSKCGGRYCVFDNTKMQNRRQVTHLLEKVNGMISENNGDVFTANMFYRDQSTGMKIQIKWDEFIKWFQQILKKLDGENTYSRLNEVASVV